MREEGVVQKDGGMSNNFVSTGEGLVFFNFGLGEGHKKN